MTKRESLTRTCAACGTEKPLSAFMQLGGKNGTSYGVVCATCRGTGVSAPANNVSSDGEHGSTDLKLRIGVKEYLEIEKQQKINQHDRQYTEEKETKKHEQIKQEKLELSEQKERAAKTHRENYIEAKNKQSFLSSYQNRQLANTSSLLGQKRNGEVIAATALSNEQHSTATAERVRNEGMKEQERITTLDLSGAPILDQQNYMVSRDNPHFKDFERWLGETPLTKTKSRLYKTPLVDSSANKNLSAQQRKEVENAPREYIRKVWGKSSGKV